MMGDVDFEDNDLVSNDTGKDFYFGSQADVMDDIFNKTCSTFIPNTSAHIFDLNSQKATSFVPLFIVLGLILVLSVLCNIVVCYIYRCRSRRSTSNFFFIFFAIFDIVGCCVGIPAEVLDLALPYVYDKIPLCKFMGFLKTSLICGQCLTLICVAFDCYKKLCRPNDEFGVKKARICCIVTIVAALLCSIPSFFVYGSKDISTIYPGVFGTTCSVDPKVPRWLRILFYGFILAPFTLSMILMTSFYCLIGVWFCKQRQAEERGEKPSPKKRDFPKTHRFVKEETSKSSVTSEEFSRLHSPVTYSPKSPHTDPSRVPLKTSIIIKSSRPPPSSPGQGSVTVPLHVKTSKQALIFMVISIIFVVFMLPFVVLTILCASTNFFNKFSSDSTEIVFNSCVRSYLLNYLVKPIIYLIFNVKFRTEVKQLFFKIWSLCTRSATEQASSRQLQRSLTMSTSRSTSRTPIYRSPYNST